MPPKLKMTEEEKIIFEEDDIKIKKPKKILINKEIEIKKLTKVVKSEAVKKPVSVEDNREIIIDVSTINTYSINWFALKSPFIKVYSRYENWWNRTFNKTYGLADIKLSPEYQLDNNENLYENLPDSEDLIYRSDK